MVAGLPLSLAEAGLGGRDDSMGHGVTGGGGERCGTGGLFKQGGLAGQVERAVEARASGARATSPTADETGGAGIGTRDVFKSRVRSVVPVSAELCFVGRRCGRCGG